MLNYISNRLKRKETIEYYYNRTQNRKIAPKEVAYGLYDLAIAGRTECPCYELLQRQIRLYLHWTAAIFCQRPMQWLEIKNLFKAFCLQLLQVRNRSRKQEEVIIPM